MQHHLPQDKVHLPDTKQKGRPTNYTSILSLSLTEDRKDDDCKQAEQGVPLQAEQADWLEDTDEEIDEQELEAHYTLHGKDSGCLT
ncbi:hypothetical protein Tco_1066459 [Tanacetum coccineum]|uniref:Uncharacterized protein n=1 Tax=Tanacetum coccineum TaxID=301880 RepID=A0ABQ5HBW3_9ASTR